MSEETTTQQAATEQSPSTDNTVAQDTAKTVTETPAESPAAPETVDPPAPVETTATGSDDCATEDLQSSISELRALPLALLFDAGQLDPSGPRRLVNIGEGNISYIEQYAGAANNLLYLKAYSGHGLPIPISDDKLDELLAICPLIEGDA